MITNDLCMYKEKNQQCISGPKMDNIKKQYRKVNKYYVREYHPFHIIKLISLITSAKTHSLRYSYQVSQELEKKNLWSRKFMNVVNTFFLENYLNTKLSFWGQTTNPLDNSFL